MNAAKAVLRTGGDSQPGAAGEGLTFQQAATGHGGLAQSEHRPESIERHVVG
ncbi:hypothetical protein [Actinomadura sp. RB99]|uniref:hypothetical protein n=1 Tax=Actinomadura sp. RB99 TaxID=2691577 RepID=UPI001682698F|nr:hypothetical protein [Actinomadura sp. RB99]